MSSDGGGGLRAGGGCERTDGMTLASGGGGIGPDKGNNAGTPAQHLVSTIVIADTPGAEPLAMVGGAAFGLWRRRAV